MKKIEGGGIIRGFNILYSNTVPHQRRKGGSVWRNLYLAVTLFKQQTIKRKL